MEESNKEEANVSMKGTAEDSNEKDKSEVRPSGLSVNISMTANPFYYKLMQRRSSSRSSKIVNQKQPILETKKEKGNYYKALIRQKKAGIGSNKKHQQQKIRSGNKPMDIKNLIVSRKRLKEID